MFIALAEKFHWTPEQIGRLDPEFIEELSAKWLAENDLASVKRGS